MTFYPVLLVSITWLAGAEPRIFAHIHAQGWDVCQKDVKELNAVPIAPNSIEPDTGKRIVRMDWRCFERTRDQSEQEVEAIIRKEIREEPFWRRWWRSMLG